VDSSRPLQLLAEPNKSIDVEGHVASGQLEVRSSSKAYFGSGDSRLTNCWSIWSKRFAAQYPQAILCLYDASHFVGMVIGLLKTHHKMLFDDVAFEGWRRS
jgi:hypothetical protein